MLRSGAVRQIKFTDTGSDARLRFDPALVGTHGFAGQVTEPGTDRIFMRARWYDPGTGLFLSVDPKVEQTLQPYLYAGGNPAQYTDPSGESFAEDFANGMIQGLSNDQLKLGSNEGSCSWAYFAGRQVGAALSPGGKAKKLDELLGAAKSGGNALAASVAYHYTRREAVESIMERGLRKGSYVTKDGSLSPLQAQIDLALPPNRGLPGAAIRVDLDAMRKDGLEVGDFIQVARKYNMPGGGTELRFLKEIDLRTLRS